jgi:hypothetical protein
VVNVLEAVGTPRPAEPAQAGRAGISDHPEIETASPAARPAALGVDPPDRLALVHLSKAWRIGSVVLLFGDL